MRDFCGAILSVKVTRKGIPEYGVTSSLLKGNGLEVFGCTGEDPANNPDGFEEIEDDDLRADTGSFWGEGRGGSKGAHCFGTPTTKDLEPRRNIWRGGAGGAGEFFPTFIFSSIFFSKFSY